MGDLDLPRKSRDGLKTESQHDKKVLTGVQNWVFTAQGSQIRGLKWGLDLPRKSRDGLKTRSWYDKKAWTVGSKLGFGSCRKS